jgi:hypothetical protein
MTAFDQMLIDLYANSDMGVDVIYTPAGGAGRPLRALLSAPHVEIGPFMAKGKGTALRLDFRIAEVPEMAADDLIEIVSGQFAGELYALQSVKADDDRLNWKTTLKVRA